MVPPLFGLISDGDGRWQVVEGAGHLRVRLYTTPDDFISLTLMEDGRYQVVEVRWRGGSTDQPPRAVTRVVRHGRLGRDGVLNLNGWAIAEMARSAGLDPERGGC
jgi:hypothetical protein